MKLPWKLVVVLAAVSGAVSWAAPAGSEQGTRHWAFQPIVRPALPTMPERKGAPENPIDAFVRARLAQHSVKPAPEADRAVLLRRVSLDLTGLPPSPEEVEAFLSDLAPDAYERLVERLLASPHHGERWGRWWLDAARYADSNGYSIDSIRGIWPYRDWVVRALNDDLPFDQFTLWQLAGDLLPSPSADQIIATGFHRNTQVNHEGGIDQEQFRIESAVDRVNTTATVWLGLTLGCAQCHDHKYDPLSQQDYYRFFAFFNQQENDGHGDGGLQAANTFEIGTAKEKAALAAYREELTRVEKQLNEWVEKDLKPRQAAWESTLPEEQRQKLKPETAAALLVPAAERNEFQAGAAFNAFRDQDKEYAERRKPVDALRKTRPSLASTLVMRERPEPRETFVMIKGDFTRPGAKVEAGLPEVLSSARLKQSAGGSGPSTEAGGAGAARTRLDLARWLTAPENPLTARVLANRIWQVYFGMGLVETENDFGRMGMRPSHPELLDWLASELMEGRWQLKRLHRLIVTSGTYRQSSKARPELAALDPNNRWLARQSRLRLEAEWIRDVQLKASGLLDARLGGPPVFPPQPEGMDAFTQNKREWRPSQGGDRYRRALYTHLQRTTLHPALAVFDAPDTYTSCTRRLRSNTPLQALTLLNDAAFFEIARGFAERLIARAGQSGDGDAIQFAFRGCLGRSAAPSEVTRLQELLAAERADSSASAALIAGETPAGTREKDRSAWLAVARVLLNLDETITRE